MSKTRTRKPAAKTYEVCRNGRKYDLIENGKVIETFERKRDAVAEMEACQADQAPVVIEPTPVVEAEPTLTVEAIAEMDRTQRLLAYKAELAALKAWKAAGSNGDEPAHPIADWMESPFRPTTKARKSKATPARTAEQDATAERIIAEGVEAGKGWNAIAADLNEASIPTARGGEWGNSGTRRLAAKFGHYTF